MDASCRIVILSSSVERGDDFVKNLQTLSRSVSEVGATANDTSSVVPGSSPEPVIYPWTISNRYYSAKVHFAIHSISTAHPAIFDEIPAVIMVWSKGESYTQSLQSIKRAMGDYEPDVLLAVRIATDAHTKVGDAEETEDDNNLIDSTLLSHGFEYIDASRLPEERRRTDNELDISDDIPHLPRVMDALSTIMWPSMTSNDSNTPAFPSTNPRSGLRSQSTLEQIVNRDPVALILALEKLDSEFSFDGDAFEDPDAFGQFLSLTSADSESNWVIASSPTDIKGPRFVDSSPIDVNFDNLHISEPFEIPNKARGFSEQKTKPKVSIGFDDDFTVFVSAPPLDAEVTSDDEKGRCQTDSGRTTPEYSSLLFADQAHAVPLYHSLGSVSDFGDLEDSK